MIVTLASTRQRFPMSTDATLRVNVFVASWLTAVMLSSVPAPASGADGLLTTAAEENDTDAVRAMLGKGGDVNQAQADGMTALHWAAYHDNEKLVRLLVQAHANVKAVNAYGVSPLSIGCQNGSAPVVELLLDAGADPQTTLPGGETVLMTASRTGRLAPVARLLARGANVNAREHKGQTALMWAAAEGHLQVVDALLDAGADCETSLPSGFTPLFFAVREGRTETALRLLKAGLDVNAAMQKSGGAPSAARPGRQGPNPLILAVENGHFETALALVKAGADPNAQPAGYGPLHALSWVRKPIRGDGNPPPVGSGQVTSLQFVRELVARGADVNLRLAAGASGFADFTTTQASPLVLAARTGDLPLVSSLLELGANPTITNADNSTALLAAAGIGDLGSGDESAGTEDEAIAMIERLLELGLDVNAVDDNGETAMHGAAYQNWPKLVAFLASKGASVKIWDRTNRWGWTPLMIARGYRKGNFRPDMATIEAIERVMREAGVTPPATSNDVVANQQTWDKKKSDVQKPAKVKADQEKTPKSDDMPRPAVPPEPRR